MVVMMVSASSRGVVVPPGGSWGQCTDSYPSSSVNYYNEAWEQTDGTVTPYGDFVFQTTTRTGNSMQPALTFFNGTPPHAMVSVRDLSETPGFYQSYSTDQISPIPPTREVVLGFYPTRDSSQRGAMLMSFSRDSGDGTYSWTTPGLSWTIPDGSCGTHSEVTVTYGGILDSGTNTLLPPGSGPGPDSGPGLGFGGGDSVFVVPGTRDPVLLVCYQRPSSTSAPVCGMYDATAPQAAYCGSNPAMAPLSGLATGTSGYHLRRVDPYPGAPGSYVALGSSGSQFVLAHLSPVAPGSPDLVWGPWVAVNSGANSASTPRMAVLESNITVVAWDERAGNPGLDLEGYAGLMRAFDADLVPLGPAITPYSYDTSGGHQFNVQVAPLGSDAPYDVVVSWNSEFDVIAKVLSFAAPDIPASVAPYPRQVFPTFSLAAGIPAYTLTFRSSPVMFRRPGLYAGSLKRDEAVAWVVQAGKTRSIHVCSKPDPVVLTAPVCTSVFGQDPFSMACVQAGVDSLGSGAGGLVVLPAGVWHGCSASGVIIQAGAVSIRGAGSEATVIDCQDAGRAFWLDGTLIESHGPVSGDESSGAYGYGHRAYSISVSGLTVKRGWAAVATTAQQSPAPRGGGGIAITSFLHGTWIHVIDVRIEDCVLEGGVGGGLYVEDARDVFLHAVVLEGNRVQPSAAGGGTGTGGPEGSGGGLYFGFEGTTETSDRAKACQVRGLVLYDVSVVGNSVIGGSGPRGGGMFLGNFPEDFVGVTFEGVVVKGNTVSGPEGGVGGGMAVAAAVAPVELTSGVVVEGNSVIATSGSGNGYGGGIALLDCFAGGSFTSLSIVNNSVDGFGGGVALLRSEAGMREFAMSGVVLRGNTASAWGGSIYAAYVSVVLRDGTVVEDSVAGWGGGGVALAFDPALSASWPRVSLLDTSRVSGCVAQYGGGMYVSGGFGLVSGSISGNSASLSGGGVSASAGRVTLLPGAQVANNTASMSGGGVFSCILSPLCGARSGGANAWNGTSSLGDARVFFEIDSGTTQASVVYGNVALVGQEWATDGVVISWADGPLLDDGEVVMGPTPLLPFEGGRFVGVGAGSVVLGDGYGSVFLGPFDTVQMRAAAAASSGASLVKILAGGCGSFDDSGACTFSGALAVYAESEGLLQTGGGGPVGLEVVYGDSGLVSVHALDLSFVPCPEGEAVVDTLLGLECVLTCGQGEALLSNGTKCLPCPKGTFMEEEGHTLGSCISCGRGAYAFAGWAKCKACPSGGTCPGGERIVRQPGWWLPEGSSVDAVQVETFLECLIEEACPGGEAYGTCGSGYKPGSFICAKCDTEYGSLGPRCVECWPDWVNYVVLVALFVGVVGGSLIMVVAGSKSVIRSVVEEGGRVRRRSARLPIVKIVLTHWHVMGSVVLFRAFRSVVLVDSFGVAASAASPSPTLFPIECVFNPGFEGRLWSSLASLAGCGLFSAAVAWPVARSLALRTKTGGTRARRALTKDVVSSVYFPVSIVIVLFFLVIPSVNPVLFSTFHCRHFPGYGYRLLADLDIECYAGFHWGYMVVSGLGILVTVGIFPVGAVLVVAFVRGQEARSERPFSPQVFFGFLLADYSEDWWWWELVVSWRKVAFTFIAVFLRDPLEQLFLGMFLLLLTLVLQTRITPFFHPAVAQLDVISLTVLVMTLGASVILSPTVSSTASWRLASVLISLAGNGVFVAVAALYWLRGGSANTVAPSKPEESRWQRGGEMDEFSSTGFSEALDE